jgi:hypothetical protein
MRTLTAHLVPIASAALLVFGPLGCVADTDADEGEDDVEITAQTSSAASVAYEGCTITPSIGRKWWDSSDDVIGVSTISCPSGAESRFRVRTYLQTCAYGSCRSVPGSMNQYEVPANYHGKRTSGSEGSPLRQGVHYRALSCSAKYLGPNRYAPSKCGASKLVVW